MFRSSGKGDLLRLISEAVANLEDVEKVKRLAVETVKKGVSLVEVLNAMAEGLERVRGKVWGYPIQL